MRLRSKTPLLVSAFAVGSLLLAQVLFSSFGPELVLNFTNSVPLGVYRLSPIEKLTEGEFVAFIPPARVREIAEERPWYRKDHYFIKQVAGLPGDEVCINRGVLSIQGKEAGPVFETDRFGIPLAHSEGCYLVPDGQVFVLGPDSEWSFDSRYFGVVRREELAWEAKLFIPMHIKLTQKSQ